MLTTYCRQDLSPPVAVAKCEGKCEGIKWTFGSWSECSKTCGGGDQSRLARCQDYQGNMQEERKCEKMVKTTHRSCGQEECPRWQAGEWSPCSVSCGRGVRQRPYWCQQESKRLASNLCDSDAVPAHRDECSTDECTTWIAGEWTPCSSDCGPGVRSRKVVCAAQETHNQLPEEKCVEDKKPISNSSCIETSCSESENDEDNAISPEDAATNKKGKKKFRKNETLKEKLVAVKNWPFHKGAKLPRYRWKIGHWTKCSADCGGGKQTRVVTCYDRVRGQMEADQWKCSRVRPRPRYEQENGHNVRLLVDR